MILPGKIIIWDAELVADDKVFCAVLGQVTKIGDGLVEVACSSEKIRLFNVVFKNEVDRSSQFIRLSRVRLK